MDNVTDIFTTTTMAIALGSITVLAVHAVVRLPARGLRVAAICLVVALVAGCGGDSTDKSSTEPPVAGSSPAPSGAPETEIEADTLTVPSDGPKKIKEFPIPGGAKIIDLGPPSGGNWQFGISSPDRTAVLAFYKKTLLDQGYTVKENVSKTLGENVVNFDLAFFGKTYGVVTEFGNGTQVTVDDDPVADLEP